MRNILLALFILIPVASFAQEKMKIDSITKKIYISATREVPLKKEEIQRKVNNWIATYQNSKMNVIELNTPDLIIIRYITKYRTLVNKTETFYNRMTIEIKDNMYTATISDIENADPNHTRPLEWYILKSDGSPKNRDYYQDLVIDVRDGTKTRLQSLHMSINGEMKPEERLKTEF